MLTDKIPEKYGEMLSSKEVKKAPLRRGLIMLMNRLICRESAG